jgi:hypothetical protein
MATILFQDLPKKRACFAGLIFDYLGEVELFGDVYFRRAKISSLLVLRVEQHVAYAE